MRQCHLNKIHFNNNNNNNNPEVQTAVGWRFIAVVSAIVVAVTHPFRSDTTPTTTWTRHEASVAGHCRCNVIHTHTHTHIHWVTGSVAHWLRRWTCDWRSRVQPQPLHCRVRPWTSCSHTLSSASQVSTLWRYINQCKNIKKILSAAD